MTYTEVKTNVSSTATATHEHNSEHGTHQTLVALVAKGLCFSDAISSGRCINVTQREFEVTIFERLREAGKAFSTRLVDRAMGRLKSEPQTEGSVAARAVVEVLNDYLIRRGPTLSPSEKIVRIARVAALLDAETDLSLAALLLPVRDRNPAKNDGPFPDLGEISTLLRLWAIGGAIKSVWNLCGEEASSLLQIVTGSSIAAGTSQSSSLWAILKPKGEEKGNDDLRESIVSRAIQIARENRKPLTQRLTRLADELERYTIVNPLHAAQLLYHLARSDRSIAWLFSAIDTFKRNINVVAIQDSHRYPCFATDPLEDIALYRKSLLRVVKILGINDVVQVVSHESLEEGRDPAYVTTFREKREAIYREKLAGLIESLDPIKDALFGARSRSEFFEFLSACEDSQKISQLFEPILHGRFHPEIYDWCALNDVPPKPFQVGFLSSIYEARLGDDLEGVRQEVLWNSVIGAAQYLASYEANTGSANALRLDDVELLVPGALRLSIHSKPENLGQFSFNAGPSHDRTPWHGSAGIRRNKRADITIEVRLSLQFKADGYYPVFHRPDSRDQEDYFADLSAHNQPMFWIHPDLVQENGGVDVDDPSAVIDTIFKGTLLI